MDNTVGFSIINIILFISSVKLLYFLFGLHQWVKRHLHASIEAILIYRTPSLCVKVA